MERCRSRRSSPENWMAKSPHWHCTSSPGATSRAPTRLTCWQRGQVTAMTISPSLSHSTSTLASVASSVVDGPCLIRREIPSSSLSMRRSIGERGRASGCPPAGGAAVSGRYRYTPLHFPYRRSSVGLRRATQGGGMEKPDWEQLGWSAAIIGIGIALMFAADPWNVAGPFLILLGVLLSLYALRPAVRTSSGYRKLRGKWIARRRKREEARCRKQHEVVLTTWESFYKSWSTAASYYHGAHDARLPVQTAWPWFRYHLEEAINAAKDLPGEGDSSELWPPNLRTLLLRHLTRIEKQSQQEPPPGGDDLEGSCMGLRDWLLEVRRDRIISLYGRCGLSEPAWPKRVKVLSREELEAPPRPTPPAVPRSPTPKP